MAGDSSTATTFRTWLGCEVFTHTEGNMTHIELSVPSVAQGATIALELAPDAKKDASINWETGNFSGAQKPHLRKFTARKIIK